MMTGQFWLEKPDEATTSAGWDMWETIVKDMASFWGGHKSVNFSSIEVALKIFHIIGPDTIRTQNIYMVVTYSLDSSNFN